MLRWQTLWITMCIIKESFFFLLFFPDWLLIIYTNWREITINFKLFFNLPLNLSKFYGENVIILCQSLMMMHSKAFSWADKQNAHSRKYAVQCFFFLGHGRFQSCVSSGTPAYVILNFPWLLEKLHNTHILFTSHTTPCLLLALCAMWKWWSFYLFQGVIG